MFDDLRDGSTPLYNDDVEQTSPPPPEEKKPKRPAPVRRPSGPFLGLTPPQRFVIALLLFLLVCVFGSFCLVLTGRVVLPF